METHGSLPREGLNCSQQLIQEVLMQRWLEAVGIEFLKLVCNQQQARSNQLLHNHGEDILKGQLTLLKRPCQLVAFDETIRFTLLWLQQRQQRRSQGVERTTASAERGKEPAS